MFRACYGLRGKLGLLKRRFPQTNWAEIAFADLLKTEVGVSIEDFLRANRGNTGRFFFSADNLPPFASEEVKKDVVARADEILENRFLYFFDKSYDLGPGPDWFLNPVTGKQAKSRLHWCDIDLFDPEVGDIKFIWEPSRFAWVYTLVRAYAAAGEEKYAEKFWSLFESWLSSNQPNMGPNYACGQECAIRLMAMCFALHGFGRAKASTAERKVKLVVAIAAHAERIEKNINFAISTKTNHSLTEAAGLYTAGTLFGEFRRAERWKRLGKDVLEKEGRRQIYADGSYIQHSMNYHRLMLQDFLWVFRLAELNGDSFSDELVGRFEKAVEFLYEMQDASSGRVPNYGPNDGTLVVPLNGCDYLDYRPVIQSCWYLLKREKSYDRGPWDEDLVWFFGLDALKGAPVEKARTSQRFSDGGYYTIRGRRSWVMVRCHSYRDRVGHVDPLHLDLWAEGKNLLRDCGTYMYFAPDEPELEKYFKSINAHNTVVVDEQSPLEPASRFLWLPLPKARVLNHEKLANGVKWVGEHFAYDRSPWRVVHRRSISVDADNWEIVDRLEGMGTHRFSLLWHMGTGAEVISGDDNVIRVILGAGWLLEVTGEQLPESEITEQYESLYYGRKGPVSVLSVRSKCNLPAEFRTRVWKEEAA